MSPRWNRRDVLKGLLASSSAALIPKQAKAVTQLSESRLEVQLTPVSPSSFRLSILPANNGSVSEIPSDGSLVKTDWGRPIAKVQAGPTRTISAGEIEKPHASPSPCRRSTKGLACWHHEG